MHDPRLPRSVRIGGTDKDALLRTLRAHGVRLNQAAEDLFAHPRFTTGSQGRVVEIVARSVAELGFAEGATYDELVTTARTDGLVECPLELGPHLRLTYLDQPEGAVGFPATQHRTPPGAVTIASVPLDDRDETPKGFYLRRIEGALWLRGYWASADHVRGPDAVLVFARAGSDAD